MPSTTAAGSWNLKGLALALRGQLRLSADPPLGGWFAPVRHIVCAPQHVGPGDVLLPETTPDRMYQWWLANEAFTRGALGVVTTLGQLAPWPGCAILVVDDLRGAAERWSEQGGQDRYTKRRLQELHRCGRNCGISTLPSLLG